MGGTEGGEEGGEGEGTRGGRERRGRDRVREGREEARMLHRHEASVGEGRVEGGRVDDGNKRGRNGARHGRREGGSERGRDCARKGWSKEMKLQGRYPGYTVYSHPIPQRALAIATLLLQMKNS